MNRSEHFLTSSHQLMILFVATYLTHGFATQFGLIAQPLQYFMKEDLHLNAAQVSSYLAIMMLPWFLEAFYGVICDFVPLWGYRSKGYLVAANLLAAFAFATITKTTSLPLVLGALVFSAISMATSIAVTAGLAVTAGRFDGHISRYLTCQMICYYLALIASSLGGGWLCQYLAAKSALHYAAGISALPALLTACLVGGVLREEKSQLNTQKLRDTWISLLQAFRSRPLRFAALFIGCWCFSPSFGVSLYFHETNTLGFSQSTIGQLAAWNAGGMLFGAALYLALIKTRALDRQLLLAVLLGTASTLAYLVLSTPASALGLEVFRGTTNMIALLAIRTLCAAVCPKHVEVAVMASLFAVWDLSTDASTFIGGQLFTHVFNNHLTPLVLVAAFATGLCALLIPFFSTIPKEPKL